MNRIKSSLDPVYRFYVQKWISLQLQILEHPNLTKNSAADET